MPKILNEKTLKFLTTLTKKMDADVRLPKNKRSRLKLAPMMWKIYAPRSLVEKCNGN